MPWHGPIVTPTHDTLRRLLINLFEIPEVTFYFSCPACANTMHAGFVRSQQVPDPSLIKQKSTNVLKLGNPFLHSRCFFTDTLVQLMEYVIVNGQEAFCYPKPS